MPAKAIRTAIHRAVQPAVLSLRNEGRVPATWTYASLAAAESSGDAWVDGDSIEITGGATFIYYSALVVDGYSGLIHKEPFGAGAGELSSVSDLLLEGAGEDPDGWITAGRWTDQGTGTKGANYDYYAVGAQSVVQGISSEGKIATVQAAPVGLQPTFFIMDDLQLVSSYTSFSGLGYSYFRCGVNATDYQSTYLVSNGDVSVWKIGDAGGSNLTTLARATSRRLFLYQKYGRITLWNNADATPEFNSTNPSAPGTGAPPLAQLTAVGYSSGGNNTELKVGAIAFGSMVTI